MVTNDCFAPSYPEKIIVVVVSINKNNVVSFCRAIDKGKKQITVSTQSYKELNNHNTYFFDWL